MAWSSFGIPFALFTVPALHVLIAPYTKVEESFTLHAAHDFLRYGLSPSTLQLWDHRTFPGAVPRSFVPPLLLGAASWPLAVLGSQTGVWASSVDIQVVVRLTLVIVFASCYTHLARTIKRLYSGATAGWFVVLSLAQFHIPYYAGRTLPNFMALPFVVLSISLILRGKVWTGIALLTAIATVVRLELALFLLPTTLVLVLQRRLTVGAAFTAGLIGGLGSLAIAAPIDYTLWAPTLPHPSLKGFTRTSALWPELSAALFNVVDGHSDDWGVMPKHYYAGALAKMLFGAFPLLGLGLVWAFAQFTGVISSGPFANKTQQRTVGDIARLFGPGVAALIGMLSSVGHKEWRFIVYALPVLNILAASTAAALWYIPQRAFRYLFRVGLLGLVGLTLAFTLFSTFVSTFNYPGGDVWIALEQMRLPSGTRIHFPSYPLQTGASLFTFKNAAWPHSLAFPDKAPNDPTWVYSKNESQVLLSPAGAWDAEFDVLVTQAWKEFTTTTRTGQTKPLWRMAGEIEGLEGVSMHGPVPSIKRGRKLAILTRVP